MRFLLRYKYGVFQEKTERLYAHDVTTTDQLLELVSAKVNSKSQDILLRYHPNTDYALKIIKGWPLSHYELKDGAELEVEVLDTQADDATLRFSNKYMLNLFGSSKREELANVAEEDEKEEEDERESIRPAFSVRKYLDQELEILLKYTQKGKLSSVMRVLREKPKNVKAELVEEIEEMKPKLLNQLGEGGWACVHYAVFCNQLHILKELIKRGVDVNQSTTDGWSPLELALNRRHLQELTQLLRHPKIRINDVTTKGTALHVAAKVGYSLGIQLLLDNGVDVKVQDERGKTALESCEDVSCQMILRSFDDSREVRAESVLPIEGISSLSLLKGTLFKAKAVFLTLRERYMVVDPYNGTMIRYEDQLSYPKKPKEITPLSSIKSIRILTPSQKSWKMKKEYYYMQVICEKRLLFASRHEEIMNIWFQGLNNSIQFHAQQESLLSNLHIKERVKNTLILDDVNNKIIPVVQQTPPSSPTKVQYKINCILVESNNLHSSTYESSSPKMPGLMSSISSSQNFSNATSFNSEMESSRKLLEKSSTSDDEDMQGMSLTFSGLKGSERIQFSSFTLIKELGSGAFGKVFLAKLNQNGHFYALKALKKRNLILGKQRKFAIEEVNILKEINHPFVINLNFAFQTPQYLYLALDYCSGRDLGYHLMCQGTFSQEDTKFYIAELILAIQYLHSKKIIYRDLKPQNILLDSDGHIKLTDFGLSKSNVEDKAKSFVGTHAYLSPDMLSGAGIDKEADIYGIGCIMFECLDGLPPYYSDDVAVLYQNIKEGELKFPSKISPEAKSLIQGLLERDPKKRLGSASIRDIKKHPFFKGLSWNLVEEKEFLAPVRASTGSLEEEDEQDELNVLQTHKTWFNDFDYSDNNKVNRFNGFSFAR